MPGRPARPIFDSSSAHRDKVMNLLIQPEASGNIALLAAGNCNDIDLSTLVRVYDQVTLVDLDERSLVAAANRLPVPKPLNLQIRAPVDLGGFTTVRDVRGREHLGPVDAEVLAKLRAKEISDVPFDVVASLCLLTELIVPIAEHIGPQDPKCLELVQFERCVHLNLLINLLRPGGQAFLISDLVSTDTAPGLFSTPREQLTQQMYRLVT